VAFFGFRSGSAQKRGSRLKLLRDEAEDKCRRQIHQKRKENLEDYSHLRFPFWITPNSFLAFTLDICLREKRQALREKIMQKSWDEKDDFEKIRTVVNMADAPHPAKNRPKYFYLVDFIDALGFTLRVEKTERERDFRIGSSIIIVLMITNLITALIAFT
jgi:hypothetical protein